MEWFKEGKKGIAGEGKLDIPKEVWTKCPECEKIIYKGELEENLWVCPHCEYHFTISSREYLTVLSDNGFVEEFDTNIAPADPLNFEDSKKYTDRLKSTQKSTNLLDAVITGEIKINGRRVIVAIMDFNFMGGSMGSVVGEKIARATQRAIERRLPLIIVSSSGGARMQEGILSLMQLAKTSGMLAKLAKEKILYISILTHPTTGGVAASYAMLGDVNIAEPKALIGFAGPRVIQQTIRQTLPEGFQRSEFLLQHGMVDMVVNRKDMKKTVTSIIDFFVGKDQ